MTGAYDDELNKYERNATALLDLVALKLGDATEHLDEVSPTLVAEPLTNSSAERVAAAAERAHLAISDALDTVQKLRRLMGL